MNKYLTVILLQLFTASGFAQKNNPRGLFRLESFHYEDGSVKNTDVEQYKYCTRTGTLQVSIEGENGFRMYNNDKKVFNYTGKTDEETSIYESYPMHFLFRWYNSNLKGYSRFPYKQFIAEKYSSEQAAREDIKTSFDILQGYDNKRVKNDKFHGVWRMFTSTDTNEGNFFRLSDNVPTSTYRVYEGDKVLLMKYVNDEMNNLNASCRCKHYKMLTDSTLMDGDNECNIKWIDDNVFLLSYVEKNGHHSIQDENFRTHEVWYRTDMPDGFKQMFSTKGKGPKINEAKFVEQYKRFAEFVNTQQLSDYDYACKYLEGNNAIFPFLMEKGYKQEYESLKSSCRQKLEQHEWGLDKALAEYSFWFSKNFDRHTRFITRVPKDEFEDEHAEMVHDGVKNYHPQTMECKLDSDTYVIRIPSCVGENPTFAWVEDAVKHFKESGCKYLIVDDRNNEGGNSEIWNPIFNIISDHENRNNSTSIFRNTAENRKFLDEVPHIVYVDESTVKCLQMLKKKFESSNEDYPVWGLDDDEVKELLHEDQSDNHQPVSSELPLKAAIIADFETGSSGETFLEVARGISDRVTIYGRTNTRGSERTGDIRSIRLPFSHIEFCYPTKVEQKIKTVTKIDKPGVVPDKTVPLPYPEVLTTNIDPWIYWVAKDMKK